MYRVSRRPPVHVVVGIVYRGLDSNGVLSPLKPVQSVFYKIIDLLAKTYHVKISDILAENREIRNRGDTRYFAVVIGPH